MKAKNALVFNQTAIKENLLPKYTNIKTHDPAVKEKPFTKDYRRKLIHHQIEQKQKLLEELNETLCKLRETFAEYPIDKKVREEILEHLDLSAKNSDHANKIKTIKSLPNYTVGA